MASIVIGVVGAFIGILTLGQCLAIVTFAIPTARQWLRDGRLSDARPLGRYKKTVLSLTAILALSVAIVWLLFPQRLVAFVIGLGVGMAGGIGALQKRADLLADFIRANTSSMRPATQTKGLREQSLHIGVPLRELAAIPQAAMRIVGEFSEVMKDTPCQVRPESILPYPKSVIEKALRTALTSLSDPESQRALQTALSELDAFLPDQDVPQDANERALEYLRRRSLRTQAGPTR